MEKALIISTTTAAHHIYVHNGQKYLDTWDTAVIFTTYSSAAATAAGFRLLYRHCGRRVYLFSKAGQRSCHILICHCSVNIQVRFFSICIKIRGRWVKYKFDTIVKSIICLSIYSNLGSQATASFGKTLFKCKRGVGLRWHLYLHREMPVTMHSL